MAAVDAKAPLEVRPTRTGAVLEDNRWHVATVLQRFTVEEDGMAKTRDFKVGLPGAHQGVTMQVVESDGLRGWQVVQEGGHPEDGEFPLRLQIPEREVVVDGEGIAIGKEKPATLTLRFKHEGKEYTRVLRLQLCSNARWRDFREEYTSSVDPQAVLRKMLGEEGGEGGESSGAGGPAPPVASSCSSTIPSSSPPPSSP